MGRREHARALGITEEGLEALEDDLRGDLMSVWAGRVLSRRNCVGREHGEEEEEKPRDQDGRRTG